MSQLHWHRGLDVCTHDETIVCALPTLFTSESLTLNIVGNPPAAASMHVNTAAATPVGGDENPDNNTSEETLEFGDLALELTSPPTPIPLGNSFTIKVNVAATITNLGPAPATAVELQLDFPDVLGLPTSSCRSSGDGVTCQVPALAAGDSPLPHRPWPTSADLSAQWSQFTLQQSSCSIQRSSSRQCNASKHCSRWGRWHTLSPTSSAFLRSLPFSFNAC
ncbi:MAG: hypothetical protein ACI9OJ_004644 [Myxococcota bacterium]|jgi:hypothetical protein